MYSQVINYIKERIEISRDEIEESLKYSEFKRFTKGNYILRAGEYCQFIGFLNKGFIVTTFVDESGNEIASEFKHEGCFFTYTEELAPPLLVSLSLLLKTLAIPKTPLLVL